MEQYSVCKQGVKNAALSAIRPWREARLIRGHFYNGTSEQVTLGGRRHDVRLTSDLRFSMTVHPPPYFWAVCRANSPPHVEKKMEKVPLQKGPIVILTI